MSVKVCPRRETLLRAVQRVVKESSWVVAGCLVSISQISDFFINKSQALLLIILCTEILVYSQIIFSLWFLSSTLGVKFPLPVYPCLLLEIVLGVLIVRVSCARTFLVK